MGLLVLTNVAHKITWVSKYSRIVITVCRVRIQITCCERKLNSSIKYRGASNIKSYNLKQNVVKAHKHKIQCNTVANLNLPAVTSETILNTKLCELLLNIVWND